MSDADCTPGREPRSVAPSPLVTFPHSAAEKFSISTDRKATIRSHCTTDVQPMHRSVIKRPTVPSFCILCDPFAKFAKERGSFFYNFY